MRFFTPETSNVTNVYDKVRYLLSWRLTLLFTVAFFFIALFFYGTQAIAYEIYQVVFLISLITLIYIGLTKRFIFSYWIFTFAASIVVTYSLIFLNNVLHYSDFMWIIAIVLFAYVGLGRKWALGFLIFHLFSILYFIIFQLPKNIQHLKVLNKKELIGISIEMLFGLFVITYLFQVYSRYKDLSESELQKANEELSYQNTLINAKNQENITLVKEIHHRVKNNLQIVISLLRMQSRDLKTEETVKHFNEAISRIMTISLIHQKLYEEKQLSTISFKKYIEDLVNEILTLQPNDTQVRIQYDQSFENVGLRTIVPLGLLLNELITNSLKHAFKDTEEKMISILFSNEGENIQLDYTDSGNWIEAGNGKSSFGTELIQVLTEQLEGTYTRHYSSYEFHLKNLDHL